MDTQELFDKVAIHILTQPRSVNEFGQCKYRGPDGKKCAVGVIIPDDEYDDTIEGCAFGRDVKLKIPFLRTLSTDQCLILDEMQWIHDSLVNKSTDAYVNHEKAVPKLVALAEMYKLNTDAIKEYIK